MGDPPVLKRPKLEKDDYESAYWPRPVSNGSAAKPQPSASASAAKPQPSASASAAKPQPSASAAEPPPQAEEDIAEEAVLALIAHREREVERCKLKLMHYQSLLDVAEKKLTEAQERLARYRDRKPPPTQWGPKPSPPEHRAPAPTPQPAARPQLVIPGANTRPTLRAEAMPGLKKALAPSSSSSPAPPERPRTVEKKPKQKIEQKEHQNLIQSVRKSAATVLRFHGGTVISSQHKRKLRCLELCPVNDQLVITRTPSRQLRLFDIRLRQTEVHAVGWKQESSESQSALINQSWSPDGWYLSSGSADPVIHIFDIRHNGQNPCQSVQAHQKRVFKALWHQTAPVLTSISSDLNIGIHKYL
ncbi:hypothetical protein ABZP36_018450 [Zizania latifolia]